MWSETRSMSAITCEAITTVASGSATPSISSCRNSRAASGSSRANGSSSRSSAGRLPSATASASRRALARRERRDAASDGSSAQELARDRLRPSAGWSRRANSIVSRDRERAVERRVAARRSRPRQAPPARAAGRARGPRLALGRGEQPDREAEERRLARAVRPGEADDRALGDRQRAVAQRPASPVALPHPARLERGGHATRRTSASRSVVEIRARMLSSSSPARSAAASQRSSSRRSASWCFSEGAASVPVMNVPRPGPRLDEAARARARGTPSRRCSG